MDHAELSKKGRNFNCQKCPAKVMKLRRCEEDRWDFTDKDASLFPIKLSDHGNAYGFCPAKVTWDNELIQLYQLLVLSFETKTMLTSGGIAEQPGWYIDLLGWFVNRYDQLKFYYRASSILGGKSKSNPKPQRASRGRHKR
jgi:hypothetical protein